MHEDKMPSEARCPWASCFKSSAKVWRHICVAQAFFLKPINQIFVIDSSHMPLPKVIFYRIIFIGNKLQKSHFKSCKKMFENANNLRNCYIKIMRRVLKT